jgi:hypothetical protein
VSGAARAAADHAEADAAAAAGIASSFDAHRQTSPRTRLSALRRERSLDRAAIENARAGADRPPAESLSGGFCGRRWERTPARWDST